MGGIDVLVNNAACCPDGTAFEATPEELPLLRRQRRRSLLMVQACFPHLKASAHRGRDLCRVPDVLHRRTE